MSTFPQRSLSALALTLLTASAGAQMSASAVGPYSSLEPGPRFEWQRLAPLPDAGPQARFLAPSALNPHEVYASSSAGLLRSVDGGASWSVMATWPGGIGLGPNFAVSPVDPLRIAIARVDGVSLSADGGATWWNPSLPPSLVSCAAFDPVLAGTLFCGTSSGVWRSSDGGTSFEQVLDTSTFPGTLCTILRIDRNDRLRVYAFVSGTGLFASHDGGESWALRPSTTAALTLALDPLDGRRILLGFDDVYLSADEGLTWTGLGVPPYVDAVAFDVLDRQRFYAGARNEGLLVTDDGGLTWALNTDPGLIAFGGNPLAILPSVAHPGEVLLAGNGGFARSTDGGVTFARSNGGLNGKAYVAALAVDAGDPAHLVARAGGSVYVSLDGGSSWSETLVDSSFSGYDLIADAAIPGRFYATDLDGNGGKLWRSDDGGFSFYVAYQDPTIYFWYLDPHPAAAGVLFAAGRGVLRSDDGGLTFTDMGLPQNWVWDVAVSRADPDTIYASSVYDVWTSRDGGSTWTAALTPPGFIVRDLEADPDVPERAWAGVPEDGLFRTDDAGVTWQRMAPVFLGSDAVHVSRGHPDLLLASDNRGWDVIASFDGGQTGYPVHPRSRSIISCFASTASEVYAGSKGHGLWVLR